MAAEDRLGKAGGGGDATGAIRKAEGALDTWTGDSTGPGVRWLAQEIVEGMLAHRHGAGEGRAYGHASEGSPVAGLAFAKGNGVRQGQRNVLSPQK